MRMAEIDQSVLSFILLVAEEGLPFKYFFRLEMVVFSLNVQNAEDTGGAALLGEQRKAVVDRLSRGVWLRISLP